MGCSDCTNVIDTCITHGTSFMQDVELMTGFEDYRDLGYQGRMSIFDYEGGATLVSILSPIDLEDFMAFSLTPAQTGALPRYDLWYSVDVFTASDVQRIYEGNVTMNL